MMLSRRIQSVLANTLTDENKTSGCFQRGSPCSWSGTKVRESPCPKASERAAPLTSRKTNSHPGVCHNNPMSLNGWHEISYAPWFLKNSAETRLSCSRKNVRQFNIWTSSIHKFNVFGRRTQSISHHQMGTCSYLSRPIVPV